MFASHPLQTVVNRMKDSLGIYAVFISTGEGRQFSIHVQNHFTAIHLKIQLSKGFSMAEKLRYGRGLLLRQGIPHSSRRTYSGLPT